MIGAFTWAEAVEIARRVLGDDSGETTLGDQIVLADAVISLADSNGVLLQHRTTIEGVVRRAERAETAISNVRAALRLLADEEAWSTDLGHLPHGPWYFNPETDTGAERPWEVAQQALKRADEWEAES